MSIKRNNKLNVFYMCELAGVSRSGYYAYLKRRLNPSKRDIQDELDYVLIKKAYDYKSWKKGAKQIKMRPQRDYGMNMNLKKIRRIMNKYHLICPTKKSNPIKKMIKAQQSNKTFGNILSRNFIQGTAKKVLLTDISYITYGKFRRAYLSVIKDSSTKMILAWQVSLTLEVDFVIETVKQLLDFYRGEISMDVLIHSDQGSHYTSIPYQQLLKENGIIQSMSRRGNCWDNAPMESFFAILKTEMNLNKYISYESMALGMADYIKYYNYDRPQWDLDKKTPYEYDEYLTSNIKLYLPQIYEQPIIYL